VPQVPALLCGCGVLYKPSEYATLTGQMLVSVFADAGMLNDFGSALRALLHCCILICSSFVQVNSF
jgi:hypothetical protein